MKGMHHMFGKKQGFSSKEFLEMKDEANELLDKQNQLMSSIKDLDPIMDKANNMLSKLQGGKGILGNLLGGMKKKDN